MIEVRRLAFLVPLKLASRDISYFSYPNRTDTARSPDIFLAAIGTAIVAQAG